MSSWLEGVLERAMQLNRCSTNVRVWKTFIVCVHVYVCQEKKTGTACTRESLVCGWGAGNTSCMLHSCVHAFLRRWCLIRCVSPDATQIPAYKRASSITKFFYSCFPAEQRPGSPGHRSPGAQEGHWQVWLETDHGLRKACFHSGPV